MLYDGGELKLNCFVQDHITRFWQNLFCKQILSKNLLCKKDWDYNEGLPLPNSVFSEISRN